MRRRTTAVLSTVALVFSLGLAGCGGGSANEGTAAPAAETDQAASAASAWEVAKETDDFGDEVEDGSTYLYQAFTGEFSNTATVSGEFTGGFGIMWDRVYMRYVANIVLLEYGDNPVTYTSSEGMTLKTKRSDGTIHEYSITGTPPKGPLQCDATRMVYDLLDEPETLRCVLEVDSSRYEFEISCAGFADAFDENRNDVLTVVKEDVKEAKKGKPTLLSYLPTSDAEAIENIKPGTWSTYRKMAAQHLMAHAFDYKRLSQEDFEGIFPGTYGLTDAINGVGSPASWTQVTVMDFTENSLNVTGYIANDVSESDSSPKPEYHSVSDSGKASVEGGQLAIEIGGESFTYEVREVAPGYYLLRVVDCPNYEPSMEYTYQFMYSCDAEGNPTEAVSK